MRFNFMGNRYIESEKRTHYSELKHLAPEFRIISCLFLLLAAFCFSAPIASADFSVTGIITPEDNSFSNDTSTEVIVSFSESTSDLFLDNCLFEIIDDNQIEIPGSLAISGDNQLIFTPQNALADSYYTVNVQLEDELGNRTALQQYHFTIDTTPPSA